ncbi:MAG: hypothetical protein GY864_04435 [Desulfobacterales bacterium]|nr:hypothetical protein [Desulfobacterales bacterium]
MEIKIIIGALTLEAELYDTPTALKIIEVLPLENSFNTWGEEIYFTVPVQADLEENAQEEVEPGDLGYWPTGQAFCIFFGPTPMSTGTRIVPASAVNIIGRVRNDAAKLKKVMHETRIRIEMI